MPSWYDEYLSALRERDKKEKASQTLYNSYTKLADRTAAFRAASPSDTFNANQPIPSYKSNDRQTTYGKGPPRDFSSAETIAKVRQDLSAAQHSRGIIEARLQIVTEELDMVKIQSSLDSKRISELTKEKATLSTGMRDRDEELRGKAKLLEDVHDETVSLTLQLNMAEEQSQKLQRENKDLVDRWMARMGQEADALNEESRFS